MLETVHGQPEQLRSSRQIPVGIAHLHMSEVGRELREVTFDIDVLPVPAQQHLDGESVAKIMEPRPVAVGGAAQADLARQRYERA
jgi:phage-related protein